MLDSAFKIEREKKCYLEYHDFILFNHTYTSIFNPENFCCSCKFKILSRIANKQLHFLDQSFII